ncbi:hypothetical protein BV22DRAFT_1135869 [Leucogyrophana mollusca]|uniref:Uncharacterized protein n=1 Tax=Leucogyrophana mollusca TaxID=85980 RepID=A0ACB8AUJ6_9AGAM|nr:hypothetical protein BV22DRAFT_1135869 [Leucogyrophana mollusca]
MSEHFLPSSDQPKWRFNWKAFLNTAYKYQIRLVNWPLGVDAPGPDFDFKELQIADFRKIVKAYDANSRAGEVVHPEIGFERWTPAEVAIDPTNSSKGTIPLVTASDNSVLRTPKKRAPPVEWDTNVQDAPVPQKKKRAPAPPLDDSDDEVSPVRPTKRNAKVAAPQNDEEGGNDGTAPPVSKTKRPRSDRLDDEHNAPPRKTSKTVAPADDLSDGDPASDDGDPSPTTPWVAASSPRPAA